MKSFRQVIKEQEAKKASINESIIGKGIAAVQNRQHRTLRTQALSKLSAIQSECRLAVQEDNDHKRGDYLFHALFDLAAVMKDFVEMSTRTNNIAAMAVFDQESLKKDIDLIIRKISGKG